MKINELADQIAQAEAAQRAIDAQCAVYEQADQLDQLRQERERRAEELETEKLHRLDQIRAEVEELYIETGEVTGDILAALSQLDRAVARHNKLVQKRERLWKETGDAARLQREIAGLYGSEPNGQERWGLWRIVGGFEEARLNVWAGLDVKSRSMRDYLRNVGIFAYRVRDLR